MVQRYLPETKEFPITKRISECCYINDIETLAQDLVKFVREVRETQISGHGAQLSSFNIHYYDSFGEPVEFSEEFNVVFRRPNTPEEEAMDAAEEIEKQRQNKMETIREADRQVAYWSQKKTEAEKHIQRIREQISKKQLD